MEPGKPQQETGSKIRPLRTYEGDIQDALAHKDVSIARIAMAESARGGKKNSLGEAAHKEESLGRSKKRFVIILLGLIVIGGSGIGGYLLYTQTQEKVNIEEAARPPLLIPVDSEKEILTGTFTRASLIEAIKKEMTLPLKVASVRALYLKEGMTRYADAKIFLRIAEVDLPGELSRSILESFTIGIHAFDGNHLFLIFKTDSYENAFTGMIAWESAMAEKFLPLFAGRNLQAGERTSFQDVIIKNKDARVLKEVGGRPLLIYSFVDKQTLVITDSEVTIEELGRRISAQTLKR